MMYTVSFLLAVAGISIIVLSKDYIKKVMGLNVFTNGIHVLLVSLGYAPGSIPPIASTSTLSSFVSYAVDPLPQALIITSIVIDVSITAVALAIIIKLMEEGT